MMSPKSPALAAMQLSNAVKQQMVACRSQQCWHAKSLASLMERFWMQLMQRPAWMAAVRPRGSHKISSSVEMPP